MPNNGIPILQPATHHWHCPNCGLRQVTHEVRPHVRMHTCPKMGMLTAPMIPDGVKAKVTRRDREDYVGNEMVQKDENGRPIMSIVTERDDGTDVIVFAPSATARA